MLVLYNYIYTIKNDTHAHAYTEPRGSINLDLKINFHFSTF